MGSNFGGKPTDMGKRQRISQQWRFGLARIGMSPQSRDVMDRKLLSRGGSDIDPLICASTFDLSRCVHKAWSRTCQTNLGRKILSKDLVWRERHLWQTSDTCWRADLILSSNSSDRLWWRTHGCPYLFPWWFEWPQQDRKSTFLEKRSLQIFLVKIPTEMVHNNPSYMRASGIWTW